MVIGALPLAFLLVHRVFSPIRKLVNVMQAITRGDLEARTEIYRPDAIGDLARSFDEMVGRVRQHQAELEQINQDLEKTVEHRTAQLETANSRLVTEIAEKEEFLRTVSHDLNAPLRNIGGMVSMLLMKHQGTLGDDIVHRLERIKSNVEIETGLIGELLELSRIKTRRHSIEPIEVRALVKEMEELFESDLRERNIELLIETPLPVLEAERMRIRQIFQNLIDNAIKYMGEGPLRQIRIGCSVSVSEAEFYVTDTGIGIDPEDLEKVFYIFRRGRNCLSQNVSGKGVGLASVKSIVETYNGRIWVESKPGEGSTFRFTVNGKFVPQCQHAEPVTSSKGSA
jgi:signal transduction histidine kinase